MCPTYGAIAPRVRGAPSSFRSPVVSAIELCDFISLGVPRRAVERRQFSDQLSNRQAEFRRSCLEHVRSVLVDLDADVGAHNARIADPDALGDRVCADPGSIPTRGRGYRNPQVGEGMRGESGEPKVRELEQLDGWLRQVDSLRRAA